MDTDHLCYVLKILSCLVRLYTSCHIAELCLSLCSQLALVCQRVQKLHWEEAVAGTEVQSGRRPGDMDLRSPKIPSLSKLDYMQIVQLHNALEIQSCVEYIIKFSDQP